MNIRHLLNLNKSADFCSREYSLAVEILLAYVIKKNREYLIAHPDEEIDESRLKEFIKLKDRLRKGEPVAYITNEKEFYGIAFYVDERVLIPRPETEFLVEKTLEIINYEDLFKYNKVNVCDMGTGCCNISVALAANSSKVNIQAVDTDKNALEVAKINIKNNDLEDRVKIVNSDLLSNINDKKYDIIIANLPYIGEETNNYISIETKKYEPEKALYGGSDGLQLYRRLFEQICNLKKYPYYILGEMGFSHKKEITKIINYYFPYCENEIHSDAAGFDRYFIVKNI